MESSDTSTGFRTEYRAGEKDAGLSKCPHYLSVITHKRFQYGMSFNREGSAYLLKLSTLEGASENGDDGLFMPGDVLQQRLTYEGVENINLPIMWAVYSIFLDMMHANGLDERGMVRDDYVAETAKVYVPDFVRYIGLKQNVNSKNINAIISALEGFKDVVGFMRVPEREGGDGEVTRLYRALQLDEYDPVQRTMTISSPYLSRLAQRVVNASVVRKKDGSISIDRNGKVKRRPSHSYTIKPSVVKQRNHAAVETVRNIVVLIEQAGEPRKGRQSITVHKRASVMVSQNKGLSRRLEMMETTSNRNRLLKTTFSKAYELLHNETSLYRKYPGMNTLEIIPAEKAMAEGMVIEFSHGSSESHD